MRRPLKALTKAAVEAIIQASETYEAEQKALWDARWKESHPEEDGSGLRVWRVDKLMAYPIEPYAANPAYRLIMALPREAALELEALMWFGRGDMGFAAALKYARTFRGDMKALAGYVTGKAPLAGYLRKGIARLGR